MSNVNLLASVAAHVAATDSGIDTRGAGQAGRTTVESQITDAAILDLRASQAVVLSSTDSMRTRGAATLRLAAIQKALTTLIGKIGSNDPNATVGGALTEMAALNRACQDAGIPISQVIGGGLSKDTRMSALQAGASNIKSDLDAATSQGSIEMLHMQNAMATMNRAIVTATGIVKDLAEARSAVVRNI